MYQNRRTVELLNNELKKKGELTFETREELITATAEILAYKYRSDLEFWRCTAADDRLETNYWIERIKHDVEPYKKALQDEIKKAAKRKWLGIIQKRKIKIDFRHRRLLNAAFRKINQRDTSINGIPINIILIIDLENNTIQQIKRKI